MHLKDYNKEDYTAEYQLLEDQIQKITDQFIAIIDKHLDAKEKEIMTIWSSRM